VVVIERPSGAGNAQATVVGRVAYTISSGKRLKVVLHLSKAALRLLARTHTLKVMLMLKGRNGHIAHQRALTLYVRAGKKAPA
jgi:hypothetical protein